MFYFPPLECPDDFTEFNGECYWSSVSIGGIDDFTGAGYRCSERDAVLTSIHSDLENEFIHGKLVQHSNDCGKNLKNPTTFK